MELTDSFLTLLQSFDPVFTAPTYQTFVVIVTGWILSQRHRYVTEVIFSSGHVGDGHWSRFHRFFSHAAWDIDFFSMHLTKLVVTILTPGATLYWAVDDTLCRKRGLTLYGAGMHYDPLISSRAKSLVSWGHDWVVLMSDRRRPLLGTDQGLRLAHRHAAVPQPPRVDQGEKESEGEKGPEEILQAQARSESSHPT